MKVCEKLLINIRANYLDLVEITYMYNIFFNENWNIDIFPSSLIKLKRLNIIDADGKLTTNGENILFDCIEEEKTNSVKDLSKFDELWLTFPKDDAYRHFQSTRPIRYNKAETRKLYEIALENRTHDELLAALKSELAYRQDSGSENKLKYMKSSVNWFKTNAYEEYMGIPDEVLEEKYGKGII